MSHIRMSLVTRTNESCHTYKRITHTSESSYGYARGHRCTHLLIKHIRMSHVIHTRGSCQILANESCYLYQSCYCETWSHGCTHLLMSYSIKRAPYIWSKSPLYSVERAPYIVSKEFLRFDPKSPFIRSKKPYVQAREYLCIRSK